MRFIYVLNNIQHCYPSLSKVFTKPYFGIFSRPKNLIIHIGNKCNANCIYCYNNNNQTRTELATRDWIKIIDVAAKMGIKSIAFSGGEPFLHTDFYYLLKHAAEKISFISIFTNGSLINDDCIQEIKKLDSNIQMVIKFDSPLTYGKHTGRPEMFQKMKEGINLCVNQEINVVAFITLTKYNIGYLEEIIESAVEMGAYPFIERFIPIEDSIINKDLEIDENDWEKALELSKKLYSRYTDSYEKLNYLNGCDCGCFTDLISITYDGYVLPCPFFPIEENLGNIKEKSLKDLWEVYKRKRKNWLKIPIGCDKCEKKYFCGGGCKTYAYLKYGNTDNKDPLCKGRIRPTYCHVGFLAASLKKGLR
jgi:radical SAM protein with 4Fe4S-binding SPASM domain